MRKLQFEKLNNFFKATQSKSGRATDFMHHDIKKYKNCRKADRCPVSRRINKISKVGTNPANWRGPGIFMVLGILNWLCKDRRA